MGGSSSGARGVSLVYRRPQKPVSRDRISEFVARPDFGRQLAGGTPRGHLYDHIAGIARSRPSPKEGDVTSSVWSLGENWPNRPVNLLSRAQRADCFHCSNDVYMYEHLPANTLVVDFANRHVGGGCFGKGFVQEEQMVVQSTDFAARLHSNRDYITENGAVTYEGVHIDAWWPRNAAAKKDQLGWDDIQALHSRSLTILAVDAPRMGRSRGYDRWSLEMLAKKVLLIFEIARELQSPTILTGLLGGGAFRNNRPLVLLLHLLLQEQDDPPFVLFHHPVFWSFCGRPEAELEAEILRIADVHLAHMRQRGVRTLGEALDIVMDANLPLSQNDGDLVCELLHHHSKRRRP